ncbi:MAG TPA: hypothetical protein VMD77_10865 [Candidatus Baltobacteraceae bacterium]|nr:hypothetical protein [Candidatus Baltobacteraceae bacterium]
MSGTRGAVLPTAPKLIRLFGAALAAFAIWPASLPANGPAKPRGLPRQDFVPVFSANNLFEFHSGFWVNLHHFLYEQAAIATAGPKGTPHEAELSTDASMAAGLSEDESKAWSDALVYYRANMLRHDLATDGDMIKIKDRLEDAEGATSVDRTDLDPKLISVLDAAAPVYRSHWWVLHDKANQTWITTVMPLVDSQGATLEQQIATAFETPWSERPLRVDVVAYANYAGSYTTPNPVRITISSIDGGNQGTYALEVLFHAASYVITDAISKKVERAYAEQRRDEPPELIPMMLWFTTGFLVEQLYPNYVMYADRFALWDQNSQKGYRAALAKDWQPRLEGKVTLDTTLSQLAVDFSVAAAPEKKPAATPAQSPSK